MSCPPIYLATVGLDRNRWGSRTPSLAVSEWLTRFADDGFDGVELWEFHDQLADDAERARLREAAAPLAIYNTYAKFNDDPEDAQQRERVALAIEQLGATGVKYNVVREADRLDENRRNVIAWAERLPESCRLLCECHPGTPLEEAKTAAAFFEGLDPVRFGAIIHFHRGVELMEPWLNLLGERVQHMHVQRRNPEDDPAVSPGREQLQAGAAWLRSRGYTGSVSTEFSRGMGKEEEVETVYTNLLADMKCFREGWESA